MVTTPAGKRLDSGEDRAAPGSGMDIAAAEDLKMRLRVDGRIAIEQGGGLAEQAGLEEASQIVGNDDERPPGIDRPRPGQAVEPRSCRLVGEIDVVRAVDRHGQTAVPFHAGYLAVVVLQLERRGIARPGIRRVELGGTRQRRVVADEEIRA